METLSLASGHNSQRTVTITSLQTR